MKGMTADEVRRKTDKQRMSGMSTPDVITAMNMDFAALELRIVAHMAESDPVALVAMGSQMFGEHEMCGDCIRVKLMTQHDPNTDPRRVCPLCRTVWPGYEPGNRRREAVMATRAKRGL